MLKTCLRLGALLVYFLLLFVVLAVYGVVALLIGFFDIHSFFPSFLPSPTSFTSSPFLCSADKLLFECGVVEHERYGFVQRIAIPYKVLLDLGVLRLPSPISRDGS
jgi:hypothetical protein